MMKSSFHIVVMIFTVLLSVDGSASDYMGILTGSDSVGSDTQIAYISPLALAVISGDIKKVADTLVKYPSSLNEKVKAKTGGRAGFTPLILAVSLSDIEITKLLIRNGASITFLDDFHRSALWYSALRENVDTTNALTGAPSVEEIINVADSDFRRTPLHIAVRGNDPQIVNLLRKAGALDNEEDILGETPLTYCKHNFTIACKGLF